MKKKVLVKKLEGKARPDQPAGYWVYGLLDEATELKEGGILFVWRLANPNGEKLGWFNTSKIKRIDGNIFETENSKYEVKYLNEGEDYKQFV